MAAERHASALAVSWFEAPAEEAVVAASGRDAHSWLAVLAVVAEAEAARRSGQAH